MRRRKFLQLVMSAGAATMVRPRNLFAADPWGELPPDDPWRGGKAYKILEIHLYGGLAPWETFYLRTGGPGFRGTEDDVRNLRWRCDGSPSGTESRVFGKDAKEKEIALGPFTKPLWRDDILARTRIAVQYHNLPPHEAAVPYMLTGLRLGRPNLAGAGASIQRRFHAVKPRSIPYSYVLIPGGLAGDNIQAAWATGLHPAFARPLPLRLGAQDDFRRQLGRENVGKANDDLLRHYRSSFVRQTFAGDKATRSRGTAEYAAALEALLNAPALSKVLQEAPLEVRNEQPCLADEPGEFGNLTDTSLRFAAYLLGLPADQQARCVTVIDNGLVPFGDNTGYDSHFNHVRGTAINMFNLSAKLSALIARPGATEAEKKGKIDLDDTLVVLNTEFGRTPTLAGSGRDHWERAYTTVLIGGPIARRSNAILGSNDDVNSVVDRDREDNKPLAFTATDVKASMIYAAGLDPFFSEGGAMFGANDVSGALQNAGSDFEALRRGMRRRIFGQSA